MSVLSRGLRRATPRGGRLSPSVRRRRNMYAALAAAVLVLAALRGALPWAVKTYANRRLAALDGYKGSLRDVDLHLWRGAYTVKGLKLERSDGGELAPFFECERAELSVEWRSLLRRRLVGEAELVRPRLNLAPDAKDEDGRRRMDRSRGKAADVLMPLTINRLTVTDGFVRYRDARAEPPFAVDLTTASVVAENLRTVRERGGTLPATIRADAGAFGSGVLTLALEADLLAEKPAFELRAALRGAPLVSLNDLLDAYAKFRVRGGTLGLYSEIAAKDGGFEGYVKPIVKDLEIEKKRAGALKSLWAHVVAAAGTLLKNRRKDQIAARVPLSGSFGDAKADLWATVGSVLQNAFVKALTPSLEGTVKLRAAKR